MTPDEEYSTERIRKLLTSKADTWREEKGYWINAAEWLLERLDKVEIELKQTKENTLQFMNQVHFIAVHLVDATKPAHDELVRRNEYDPKAIIFKFSPEEIEGIRAAMNAEKKP